MPATDQQAKSLFLEAVEKIPPDQWLAFLDARCQTNAELRREVEGLLKAHREADSLLDQEFPDATQEWQTPVEIPGTQIGPYLLLEKIGEGGMGTVFLAEQEQPVTRKVALKIIKPGMDTREVIARFESERQALALLDHPHIAKVLDAGTTGTSGRPFFVMERVKGFPITEFCDAHQLSTRERLELFVDVCRAVQHAHQKGIIHRDIKPSNVMVALHDDRPIVKVIDFGIAKMLSRKLTDQTIYTALGPLIGTPAYRSPEQAQLNALDVDTRSDVYSLGVLLYELLTGTTPFDVETLRKAGFDEFRRIIREEEPPRPSARISMLNAVLLSTISGKRHIEPRKLSQSLKGELDWIVMKALEKDRGRRYESASGFAADVERYLADEPVLACPPSAWYRFSKFVRRNKRLLTSVAVLTLAVLVVVGTYGWAIRDREAQRQELTLERARHKAAIDAEVNLALSEAERWQEQGDWPEALSAAKRAEGLLAQSASDELRESVRQLRKDLEFVLCLEEIPLLWSEWIVDNFDFGTADLAHAKAFGDYGIDVFGRPVEEVAARIRERRGISVALVAALGYWFYVHFQRDAGEGNLLREVAQAADPDPWRRQVRHAVKEKDALALADSPEFMRQPPATMQILARQLRPRGNVEGQIEVLRQAQRQYPADFWLNFNLAGALTREGFSSDNEEAISFYRAAAALRPRSSAVHTNLGECLARQKRVPEAIAVLHRAIELDPTNPRAYNCLAGALVNQNELSKAIAAYRQAIKLEPGNSDVYVRLGNVLKKQERRDEAIICYRKAIELDPKSPSAHYGLGICLHLQDKVNAAMEYYRKAIELDPNQPHPYATLAVALNHKRKVDEALVCARKSIELDADYAYAHFVLGDVLRGQGKVNDALACYRKAIELDPKCHDAHFWLAWQLTTRPDLKLHEQQEALESSRLAVQLAPKKGIYWQGLGYAEYRSGNWKAAILAFEKLKGFGSTGDSIEWFPLAMAHWQLGDKAASQQFYDQAVDWREKHNPNDGFTKSNAITSPA